MPGDVALALADRVGPSGAVVGVDKSATALAHAAGRCERQGVTNVTFVCDDLHTAAVSGPFDAVVGRLVLLYTPDPAMVLKRYAAMVRPGGVVVSMEYEIEGSGAAPRHTVVQTGRGVDRRSVRALELDPSLGVRLGDVLQAAGLERPTVLGFQRYLPSSDPVGARMATGIIRTLVPVLERTGLATASEIGIDTLEQRFAASQAENEAIFKPPTLVGAWARVE